MHAKCVFIVCAAMTCCIAQAFDPISNREQSLKQLMEVAARLPALRESERLRASRIFPRAKEEPLRYENISDEEVREVQAVARSLYPNVLVHIGPVVTGCVCEDGPNCTEQVWVMAQTRPVATRLLLSQIKGRWAVGPVQTWWLREGQLERASRERPRDPDIESQMNEHLKALPACGGG
jgi:hypothetical protein